MKSVFFCFVIEHFEFKKALIKLRRMNIVSCRHYAKSEKMSFPKKYFKEDRKLSPNLTTFNM